MYVLAISTSIELREHQNHGESSRIRDLFAAPVGLLDENDNHDAGPACPDALLG
jgi:hypothetical protein